MKQFGYLRDGVCLASCGLYALNRWGLKPICASPFLHSYFNDILLIPAALPLVLWLQRRLGLRAHDALPSAGEILLHLVVWSVVCELVGPHLLTCAIGDPFDVVAYAVGALLAWGWWHRPTAAPSAAA